MSSDLGYFGYFGLDLVSIWSMFDFVVTATFMFDLTIHLRSATRNAISF